jgi:hypothetical protein
MTPTPSVTPTETMTPSVTPTATLPPTHTATVTPTATPLITGVKLEMPSTIFHTGDTCWCSVTVTIAEADPLYNHSLWVILDIYGDLFFAPSFTHEPDAWPGPWNSGQTEVMVLEHFTWPETGSSANGIFWYAALTTPDVSEIYGEWDSFEFGWE